MSVIEMKWRPSDLDLRVFAVIQLVVAGALSWLLHRRFGWDAMALGLLATSLVALLAGIVLPQLLRSYYVLWMLVGFPIGWVVSHALIVVIYYAVMTPVGLALRLRGRDAMQLKVRSEASTYWSPRPEPVKSSRYFQQF